MIAVTSCLLLAFAPAPPIQRGLSTLTPVLTYHDMVSERTPDTLWFDCTPAELTQQLNWLKSRGASFISIGELYRHLVSGETIPQNAVAITFADNYLGFYTLALPILRKEQIPVTMFVHTDYVGSQQGRPKMTWDQLLELDREGLVTIASQTQSHPTDLRTLSSEQLQKEFHGSRLALEKRLKHPIRFLAYPNGKFSPQVATQAASAGYLLAFTEEQKPAQRSPSIFQVARYVHTEYRKAWQESHPGL